MGLCTAMRPVDSDSQPTDPQKEPAQQRHFLCVDNPRLMQATLRPHIRQPAACPVLWGTTCCQRSSYRCHYNNAENHDNVHIMQLFPNFMKGKKSGGTFRRHLSGEAPHRVSDSPPFVPSASPALGLGRCKHLPSLDLRPGPPPDGPRRLRRSISPGCRESSLMITKQEHHSARLHVRCDVTHSEAAQQGGAFGGMCTTRPKGSPAHVPVGLDSHFARGFNQQLLGRSQK